MILQRNNFWKIRAGNNEVKTVYLNPKIFEKYNYSVGDEISIDAELQFFFEAMEEAGLDSDNLMDMTHMNGQLVS